MIEFDEIRVMGGLMDADSHSLIDHDKIGIGKLFTLAELEDGQNFSNRLNRSRGLFAKITLKLVGKYFIMQ